MATNYTEERRRKWQPIIENYALQYNVSAKSMIDVARCESGFNPDAHNKRDPNGGSFGIFQYQLATFYGNAPALFGEPDIWNPEQQIELTAYLFSKGKMTLWSCWYLVNGLPVPWLTNES